MKSILTSITPLHPALADENRSVKDPVLLYSGKLVSKWPDKEKIYRNLKGRMSPEQIELTSSIMTGGVEEVGKVAFKITPEPHINGFFQYTGWPAIAEGLSPVGLGWPVLVPPSSPSEGCVSVSKAEHEIAGPAGYGASGWNRILSPAIVGKPDAVLDEVYFYLVNFQVINLVDDLQGRTRTEQGKRARLNLKAGEWHIDIDRRPDFIDALHHLEEYRGYAVTHNCRLWKESSGKCQTFTFEQAQVVLEAVQLFFSFIRSGMVGLALPVGRRQNKVIVEEWSVTTTDPGRYADPDRKWPLEGWYLFFDGIGELNHSVAQHLPHAFSEFSKMWLDIDSGLRKVWQSIFRQVIFSYTDAERAGDSRGIVPACTALETLGWAILVIKEGWLTGDRPKAVGRSGRGAYEKLLAEDRLRLLLHWAGIPIGVPASILKMKMKKKTSSTEDGPEIVTWARNRAVHPDKHDQLSADLAGEAWATAMRYTELVMLRLLGYKGHFRDRLDSGKIRIVPWEN